jgi:hypothetical protein
MPTTSIELSSTIIRQLSLALKASGEHTYECVEPKIRASAFQLSIGSGHDFPGSRVGRNQMLNTQRLHRNVERHAKCCKS